MSDSTHPLFSEVVIRAERGDLTEVSINGTKLCVAEGGLLLHLEHGYPTLEVNLLALNLTVLGQMPAFITNATPAHRLVETTAGMALLAPDDGATALATGATRNPEASTHA